MKYRKNGMKFITFIHDQIYYEIIIFISFLFSFGIDRITFHSIHVKW